MKIIIFLALIISPILAQFKSDWETITTANEVTDLVVDQQYIWAATTGGLLSRDLNSAEPAVLTNIDGLKSVRLSAVERDANGNVITGGDYGIIEVYNLASREWKQIYTLQDYAISDFHSTGDTLWVVNAGGLAVFLWDGFGYNFIDYINNFKEFPQAFNCVQHFAGYVWLGTDVGLFRAPSDFGKFNISDPAQWRLIRTTDGLPGNEILNLKVISNELWVLTETGLARIDAASNIQILDEWFKDSGQNYISATYAAAIGDDVYVATGRTLYVYNPSYGFSGLRQYDYYLTGLAADESGRLWLGLNGGGLLIKDQPNLLRVDGPANNLFRSVIRDSRGWLWASSGKPKHELPFGFYLNKGEQWLHYTFTGTGWIKLNKPVCFYEDRYKNIWIGTWGASLMAFTAAGEMVFFHNYTGNGQMIISSMDTSITVALDSSSAQIHTGYFAPTVKYPTDEIITAVKEDLSGRLWITNYWADNDHLLAVVTYGKNNLVSLDSDDWTYFGSADGIAATEGGVISLEVDQSNRIWVGTISDGVYILDHNNTISNKSDDLLYHLGITDNLYSNRVYSIAADNDGIVWIGTSGGLNSFDGTNVYKHVGDPAGKSGPLENHINQIKIDKYNNKWFATTGGLSILRTGKSAWDASGWEGYSADNSGLLDNEVHAIFIDNANSAALIGTENGLSVYRGKFAEIRDDFNAARGGPNPFITEGSSRVFTFRNLKYNSVVKVFNLNGMLIRELNAQKTIAGGTPSLDGSRAYWDGLDEFGDPVASGIYLFMAYDLDGSSTSGKIAVIRK